MNTKTLIILATMALGLTPLALPAQTGGTMKGMDMSAMKSGGMADMKTAVVPQLEEKGTYTVTGKEDWKMQTGFGHNAPMVGMMNQMMVGGSGMEGMKMPPMKMNFGEANYAKPEGDTTAGTGDMAGMDMSGGKPNAPTENKPAAQPDSMAGMKMDAPVPAAPAPAVPPPAPMTSAPPKVSAAITAPKAGDNALQITLTDAQGKPVIGAKIATTVAMTSMDMGTAHPAVKEMGNGHYAATVNFGMAGPWRVNIKVTPQGQKPLITAFDFMVK